MKIPKSAAEWNKLVGRTVAVQKDMGQFFRPGMRAVIFVAEHGGAHLKRGREMVVAHWRDIELTE